MTTHTEDAAISIEYESAVPTVGGPDAADFQISRVGHASIECALYLALDARRSFEALCGGLDDDQVQAVIRAIGEGLYRAQIGEGIEPPATQTIRAGDLSAEQIDSVIDAAGLSRMLLDD